MHNDCLVRGRNERTMGWNGWIGENSKESKTVGVFFVLKDSLQARGVWWTTSC